MLIFIAETDNLGYEETEIEFHEDLRVRFYENLLRLVSFYFQVQRQNRQDMLTSNHMITSYHRIPDVGRALCTDESVHCTVTQQLILACETGSQRTMRSFDFSIKFRYIKYLLTEFHYQVNGDEENSNRRDHK